MQYAHKFRFWILIRVTASVTTEKYLHLSKKGAKPWSNEKFGKREMENTKSWHDGSELK